MALLSEERRLPQHINLNGAASPGQEQDVASAGDGDIFDQFLDNYELSFRPEVRLKFKQQ